MKTMRQKLWMMLMVPALALGLGACGGGDDSEPATPSIPTTPADDGVETDPNIPTLGDVKFELSPDAVLVPEQTAKGISNVNLASRTFTLPLSATKPKVGQTLIINTPTADLHDGLLAKVTAVSESGSGYTVSYKDAELKDAFKTLEIEEQYIPLGQYVEHVYDGDGNEIAFSRSSDGGTRAKGDDTFKISIPEIGWSLGSGLELTPKMTLDLALRYVLMYGDYQIDYANVKVDCNVTIGADLGFELKSAKLVNYRHRLLSIVCAGIPVGPVVITPGIDIAAVFKVDGKLSLEASISYTRTVHVNAMYQTGKGLSASASIDPEKPDALKFNFGPKFEGTVAYGLAPSPFVGLYGKVFALHAGFDVVKKESISTKINLLEVATGTNLTSAKTIKDSEAGAELKGSKWDFLKWDGVMYNQAYAMQPYVEGEVMGMSLGDVELPDINYPTDSRHILPQINIDEGDFLTVAGETVTLKMHMPNKSLFDREADIRAEWTNTNDAKDIATSQFDLDDAKADLLEEDKSVDIEAKTKLKKGQSYNLNVTMTIGESSFTLYKGTFTVEGDASVSPSELRYPWEGSSQTVTINKGGYNYCGADVHPIHDYYISAVANNDGTVAIAVQPNLTFGERQGTVNCWVSTKPNPKDDEKKYLPVTIYQDAISGVGYSPTELTFTGDGGSQDVSITWGPFKRYGATVGEAGKGWCSVKAANGKITITVQPNPEQTARSCVVNCFVTNVTNPTDEDKVLMPVEVYQEGSAGEVAANNFTYLWGTWYCTNGSTWSEKVTFSKNGSYYCEYNVTDNPSKSYTRTGSYKVLTYTQAVKPENAASAGPDDILGIGTIEETYVRSDTGKQSTRKYTVSVQGDGKLHGYEYSVWTRVE